MRISALIVSKFRGVENTKFDFKKENIFKGSNGVGKTTCLDALTMLLCGETYTYDKDATKNRDMNNEREVNDISMVVETDEEAYNENGDLVKVEQVFGCKMYEAYKGKKGEKTDEYVGFKTDWQLNGKKVTEKEYFNKIKETFNINYNNDIKNFNIFRFLIDYNYTNTCDYKAMKQFIESILDIKPDNEILKQEEFRLIAYDLMQNKYDVKAVNSIYNTKIKTLENAINAGNAVLSNLDNLQEDNQIRLDCISIEHIKEEIKSLENKRVLTDEQIQTQTNAENQLRDLINARNEAYESQKEALTKNIMVEINEIDKNYNENAVEQSNAMAEGRRIKDEEERIKNDILKCFDSKNVLCEQLEEIQNKKFKIKTCPECGYELNKDEQELFENEKTAQIAEITKNIASINSTIDKLQKRQKELENNFKLFKNSYEECTKKGTELSIRKNQLYTTISTITDKIVLTKFDEEIEKAKATVEGIQVGIKEATTLTEEELKELDFLKANVVEYNQYMASMEQINTSKEQKQKEIDNALDEKCKVEEKQIILNSFKEYKTQLIAQNTHKVFDDINWVLQEESKANADSKKDKCYATLGNVSMDGVNTASKLVLGAKIIACVKKYLGVQGMPLVFDIVDNIGRKALSEVENLDNGQIFCTKAEFDDGIDLYLEKR